MLKPLPLIVTAVNTGPAFGVNVSDGVEVVTMKVAIALSPVEPVTLTVADTVGAAGPTLKVVACNVPDDVIVQVFGPSSWTGTVAMVHVPASLGENPLPTIETLVP